MRTIRPADGPPADAPPSTAELFDLIEAGIRTFQHTRDYVGEDVMPAVEGWSWFDWTRRAEAMLAREPVVEPVTPPEPADEPLFKAIARVRGYVHETPGSADLDRIVDALHAPSVLVDSPEQRLDEQVEAELIRLDDANQVGTAAVIRALTAELRAARKAGSVLVDSQGREPTFKPVGMLAGSGSICSECGVIVQSKTTHTTWHRVLRGER